MFITAMSLAKRLAILISVFLVAGCAATKTFHQIARAGDTVAIATGWHESWSRDNITVWVKEYGGTWVQYQANDPSIRAVVNFYPDPVSSLVVSERTGQDITAFAQNYGNNVTNMFTSGSHDWFSTVVFFDLPSTMNPGIADVYVEEIANTNNYVSTTVDIVSGVGQAHEFEAQVAGQLQRQHLASLERASHYAVTLSGTGPIPYAVQMDFTHDPDVDHAGVGRAYVVEPISGVKNITWSDDGSNLRVIILPANGNALTSFKDFKFYVAGGINNLAYVSTQAFNINGVSVSGVSPPTITPHNIVITTAH
jgi:hypothetical protein